MFISVVLNTEYMDIASRSKWYLKNLLHCKENGWILITHEYLWKHFEEIQQDITPRLFYDFEMRPFKAEEVKDVEQYFIPDRLFEMIEKQCGSRTEFLFEMTRGGNPELETVFQGILDTIKKSHPNEPIDGIFHCLEGFEPLRNVAKVNDIPIISYVFSALRKPHGYRQTLYSANFGRLYCGDECEKKWHRFQSEDTQLLLYSNRELIAIFGKDRTLPLIDIMAASPKYEINVCGEGFDILPHIFSRAEYCDEDIYYECAKYYKRSQMRNRQHPIHLDALQISRDEVHNDPAAWILSSKRMVATCSQMILKAALWNRIPVMPKNTLPFSFMCSKDITDENKVPLDFLNFYLFCYLIPNDLMFSGEYWQWRMTNPTETEIYKRHLDFYIEKLNLPKSILTEQDEPTRFKSLLKSRGCDEELINILLEDKHDFDIDYNTASSRIMVNGKSYWRLNKIENGVRHFHIELSESADTIDFYPLDDVAGCARLVSVSVNGKPVDVSNFADFRYMPKVSGHYTLPFPPTADKTIIDIAWDYQSNKEFLNAHS